MLLEKHFTLLRFLILYIKYCINCIFIYLLITNLIFHFFNVLLISLILAPTGPPYDLISTNVTNQTMTFSWKQPVCGQRNSVITQYHYTLIDNEEDILEEHTISNTRVEFTNLVPFTIYTLSVSAGNQFGSGPVAQNTSLTKEGSK